MDKELFSEIYEFLSSKKPVFYSLKDHEFEDFLHDVMERILNKLPLYDKNKGDIKGWSYQIMKNMYVDRGRKIKGDYISTSSFYYMEDKSEYNNIDVYENILIFKILNIPNSSQRSMMLLRSRGYGYEEISKKTGENINNVKSIVKRGKDFIRSEHQGEDWVNDFRDVYYNN